MVFKVYHEVRDATGKLRFSSVYRGDCNTYARRLESKGVTVYIGEVRRGKVAT